MDNLGTDRFFFTFYAQIFRYLSLLSNKRGRRSSPNDLRPQEEGGNEFPPMKKVLRVYTGITISSPSLISKYAYPNGTAGKHRYP